MGIPTNEINLEGPFTREEAEYIGSRKRLREELRAAGTLHLLQPENFADADEPEEEEDDEGQQNPEPQNPSDIVAGQQVEGSLTVSDQSQEEQFEPTDYSEKNVDELKDEIRSRNEKIEAFNADVEDEDEQWDTLLLSGNKADLIETLTAHDLYVWQVKHAEDGSAAEADETTE